MEPSTTVLSPARVLDVVPRAATSDALNTFIGLLENPFATSVSGPTYLLAKIQTSTRADQGLNSLPQTVSSPLWERHLVVFFSSQLFSAVFARTTTLSTRLGQNMRTKNMPRRRSVRVSLTGSSLWL